MLVKAGNLTLMKPTPQGSTIHLKHDGVYDGYGHDQAGLLCKASLRQELYRTCLLSCKDLSWQVDHTGNITFQLMLASLRVGQISQRMSCTKEGKILCQPGWTVSELHILENIGWSDFDCFYA